MTNKTKGEKRKMNMYMYTYICMQIFLELLLAHRIYIATICILSEFLFPKMGLRNCNLPFSVDLKTCHKGILLYSCHMDDHQILIALLSTPGPVRRMKARMAPKCSHCGGCLHQLSSWAFSQLHFMIFHQGRPQSWDRTWNVTNIIPKSLYLGCAAHW